MQTIFQAVGHFITEISQSQRTVVASFKTREAAIAFITAENEEAQAPVLSLEEVPCVDDYGYPVARAEYAALYPQAFVAQHEEIAAHKAKEDSFKAYCREMGLNS